MYVMDARIQLSVHKPRITTRWILLGLIAAARGVFWITEQPRSSLMPALIYMKYAALVLRPTTWNTVTLWDTQCVITISVRCSPHPQH